MALGKKKVPIILEEGLWADAEESARAEMDSPRVEKSPNTSHGRLPCSVFCHNNKESNTTMSCFPVSAVTNYHKFSGTLRDLEYSKVDYHSQGKGSAGVLCLRRPQGRNSSLVLCNLWVACLTSLGSQPLPLSSEAVVQQPDISVSVISSSPSCPLSISL